MDEIVQAAYEGTELEPYGYYPTDPERLRAEPEGRNLRLGSSYVPLPLGSEEEPSAMLDRVL